MTTKLINKKDLLLYYDKNNKLHFGGNKIQNKKTTILNKIIEKTKNIFESDDTNLKIKDKIKQKKIMRLTATANGGSSKKNQKAGFIKDNSRYLTPPLAVPYPSPSKGGFIKDNSRYLTPPLAVPYP